MVSVYIYLAINSLHHPPPDLSDAERKIIARFAEHLRTAHSTVMPIRELAVLTDSESRKAIDRLIDRGWLVTNATLHWNEEHQCVLCGQGLTLARQLVAEEDPEGPSHKTQESKATSMDSSAVDEQS